MAVIKCFLLPDGEELVHLSATDADGTDPAPRVLRRPSVPPEVVSGRFDVRAKEGRPVLKKQPSALGGGGS